MTLEELKKTSTQYFKKGAELMYCTEDGNFFYPESKAAAEAHAKQSKQELHVITEKDLKSKAPKAKKAPKPTEEVKPEDVETQETKESPKDNK